MRVSGGCSTPEACFPTSYITTAEAMWYGSSTVLLNRNIVCMTRANMTAAAIIATVRQSTGENPGGFEIGSERSNADRPFIQRQTMTSRSDDENAACWRR